MKNHLQITAIPAYQDNYMWIIINSDNHCVVVVDPGEAEPVLDYLDHNNYQLSAILVTHRHWDHTNGIAELLQHYPVPVHYPEHDLLDDVTYTTQPIRHQQTITLDTLNLTLTALHIPGHTRGHVAYWGNGWTFTGDTLFAGGCGRIFEGTVDEMYQSLQTLKQLPPDTQVYCGHEYTLKNLEFASIVEPDNPELVKQLATVKQQRTKQQITLPSTIALEQQTNPFLRCDQATIKKQVEAHCGMSLDTETAIFKQLRGWKDSYK